jgi:hypothetical protein
MTEREERAKEWLNRNYGFALECDAIQRRLDRMQSDIEKCVKPIRLKEVQEQNSGNSQEDKLATWIDMAAELEKKRYILLARDEETKKVIDMVESHVLRAILIERYINRRPWRSMPHIFRYERSRLFDLHLQALDAVIPFIPTSD